MESKTVMYDCHIPLSYDIKIFFLSLLSFETDWTRTASGKDKTKDTGVNFRQYSTVLINYIYKLDVHDSFL